MSFSADCCLDKATAFDAAIAIVIVEGMRPRQAYIIVSRINWSDAVPAAENMASVRRAATSVYRLHVQESSLKEVLSCLVKSQAKALRRTFRLFMG